jgi:glycosyltransferase involved in cell wall biosynthesis
MALPAREVTPQITPETTMAALHVVHLIEALGPGGAERLLYTNLKHFDPSRVRSTVCTVYARANHWLEPIRELGVPVISLDCEGPRNVPGAIRKFAGWLRANRPDVIHSHLWAANVVARVSGRLAGVPVLSSVHNPDHEDAAWSDGAEVSLTKRKIAKGIDRWTARVGNERLIAVSEYVRHSANRHLKFSLDEIDLLYNPIDTDALTNPPQKDRSALLREMGLPQDAIILLNVARLSPQKGLIHALRALPTIIEQYPQAHLLSVGATTDPAWHEELKTEANRSGVADHFHILGTRRDVTDFLRACDVFVFPSLYEGLGIALIEAMAAGCACVATTAGPIPEFVENQRNGVLVPPADSEAMAAAVCELLAQPERRKQLAENARETALARFQPQAAADRLTQIYEKVARSNSQVEEK